MRRQAAAPGARRRRRARDARAAREAGDAGADGDARVARAAWDARAARAAWAAWDARDAWDALTVEYAALMGWTKDDPDLHTTGIRDAYRCGLEIVLPTGPNELGWALSEEIDR